MVLSLIACPDYSTDKFLLGFRRFVATRGTQRKCFLMVEVN